MKDCEYYMEKISCLIDGELSPEETAGLEEHIAACAECKVLYDAFTAVSAAVRDGMEEPPEQIAPAVMQEVRAIACKKKRGVWIKYLSAAACLALVVLVGARSGLFGGVKDTESAETVSASIYGELDVEPYNYTNSGDSADDVNRADEEAQKSTAAAEPLDIDAKSAYFTSAYGDMYYVEDAGELEKLKVLMAPLKDVERAPSGEPNYNLSFDCGDEFVVMEVYIEDDVVFADSGEGPYVVYGSPNEILAYIK